MNFLPTLDRTKRRFYFAAIPAIGLSMQIALAQNEIEIKSIKPPLSSGGNWRLEVKGKSGVLYDIQNSVDLLKWETIIDDFSASGAVQSVEVKPPHPLKGFFRVIENSAIDLSTWDLSSEGGPYGVLLISASGGFVATEILERQDGEVTRRNAGFQLVDSTSGLSLLVHLLPSGIPDFVILNNELIIEFTAADRSTKMVTWQVRDITGTLISAPKTDKAPDSFFGTAPGEITILDDKPVSKLSNQITAVTEGTISLLGAVGTRADSKASVIINTVGILATPVGVASTLGTDFGTVVNGAKWGVDAAQCGLFISEAVASSTPVTAIGWVGLSASAVPGLLSCRDTIKPIVEVVSDAALQNLEARDLAAELTRLAGTSLAEAGSALDTQLLGQYSYSLSRRNEFFVAMNRARAFMRESQAVIDTKFPVIVGDESRENAQQQLDAQFGSYAEKINANLTAATTLLDSNQTTLQVALENVDAAQEDCNSGNGCTALEFYQEFIRTSPQNIEVAKKLILALNDLNAR